LKEERELKHEGADMASTALSFRNNPEYTLLHIMSAAKITHYQFCMFLHTAAEYIFEQSYSEY
jgi:tRNA C32,U32 (ribose-2'-O)-methylase TrmJ